MLESPATNPGRAAEEKMRDEIARLIEPEAFSIVDTGTADPKGWAIPLVSGARHTADRILTGPLAQLQADLIAARKERDEARRDHDALAQWWKMNPSLIQHRIAAAEAEAAQLRARLHEAEKGAEAMRGRCMEVVQAVYDGWDRFNPEEKWARVALSNAMAQIRQIPPQIKEAGDGR